MKKAKSETVFSLFSFQDIITSITGIMMLVVLMLVLQILEQKFVKSPMKSISNERIEELKTELEELKKLHEQEKKFVEENKLIIQNLSKLNIHKIDNKLEALKLKLKLLKSKNAEYISNNQEKEKEDEENKKKLSKLNKNAEELQKLIIVSKELKEKMKQNAKKVKFIAEKSQDGKEPIVVLCTNRKLEVKIQSSNEYKSFTNNSAVGIFDMKTEFYAWMKEQDKDLNYFLFLIKPSALYHKRFYEGAAKKFGFECASTPVNMEIEL